MIAFSTARKVRITRMYPKEFKELVRAYLYGSEERIARLISDYLNAEDAITKGDVDLMISLAQDFAATYQMMGLEKQSLTLSLSN